MEEWIEQEFAPWRGFDLPGDLLRAEMEAVTRDNLALFLFELRQGVFSFDDKSGSPYAAHPYREPMVVRAESYRAFFQASWDAFGGGGDALFVVNMADLPEPGAPFPVLCFQKLVGSREILLPDVDFINNDFYRADRFYDPQPFEDKQHQAVFVGSTTGDLPLTADHVLNRKNARIRSAVFFLDKPDVIFNLPNIVQCDSPETHQLIVDAGVTGYPMRWMDQTRFKYMISMDGNGATCSRVYGSLISGAVLLKYHSIYELHYFKGLKPWVHYIPIHHDREVVEVTSVAGRDALHRFIAEASRSFARAHLSRIHLMAYTARLIDRYVTQFGDAAGVVRGTNFFVDALIHVHGDGPHWGAPAGWAGGGGGQPLEGYTLMAGPGIDDAELEYRAFRSNGAPTRWVRGGELCGARGGDGAIHGLQVRLRGRAARRFRLSYDVAFDGQVIRNASGGRAIKSAAPLLGFRLILRERNNVWGRIFGRSPLRDDARK